VEEPIFIEEKDFEEKIEILESCIKKSNIID
jgi:hypothetical protein